MLLCLDVDAPTCYARSFAETQGLSHHHQAYKLLADILKKLYVQYLLDAVSRINTSSARCILYILPCINVIGQRCIMLVGDISINLGNVDLDRSNGRYVIERKRNLNLSVTAMPKE